MTTNGRRGLAGWGGIWRHHCCRSWISFVAAISTRYLGTRRTAACFNMVMPKWRQQLKQTRWRPVLSGCQLIFVCKANPALFRIQLMGRTKPRKNAALRIFEWNIHEKSLPRDERFVRTLSSRPRACFADGNCRHQRFVKLLVNAVLGEEFDQFKRGISKVNLRK